MSSPATAPGTRPPKGGSEPAQPHSARRRSGPVHQLVYISAATRAFEQDELTALLEHARKANEGLGVGGLLLYYEGAFLQLLEGGRTTVEYLYRKIERDPRHRDAVVLSRSTVEAPQFSDWRMGFLSPDPDLVRKVPGLSDFLRTGLTQADASDRVLEILREFKAGRWRSYVRGG